ncbi:MAG: MATE family efflux transporter [Eubacteriales bacterium]
MQKLKNIDMTNGPLFSKIVLFVLPLMATNLLQVLYNTADMIVVSMSTEADAVGAIGITGALINLVLNVFMGFATGANVVVARCIGAGDDKMTSKAVHTSIIVSLIFGLIGGAIGIAVARPVLTLMDARGKLLDLATVYTQIYFASAPFISVANCAISIFRAKGDTKTPLFVLTASGLLNVALNLFFVLVLGRSADGVALATAASNIVASFLLIFLLMREKGSCRFSFKDLRIDKNSFTDVLKIGLPAGIQGSLFSLSNMIIQSSVLQVNNAVCPPGSEFQPVVKGNSATANLEGFIYTATNSVYQASITFTSQNVGAGKFSRIKKVMKCCYSLTFCIAIIFSGIMLGLSKQLLSLYGIFEGAEGTLERIAYNTAIERMLYMFTTYFLLAFMEVGSGVVRGLGKSTASTIISLVGSCIMRIVWIATVFRAHPTLGTIFISYPISWGLTAAVQFSFAVIYLIKKRKSAGSGIWQEDM